jgi:hypothetical protein
MAFEVVVVDLNMSVSLQSQASGEPHVLASEGFRWIARLNDCETFGIASNDIVVLVVLQERLPLLAAVFAPASVLRPGCLDLCQCETSEAGRSSCCTCFLSMIISWTLPLS